jgi:hypothetical protein
MPVLYVTCGWRDVGNEPLLRKIVTRSFLEEGFHLIGDATDHANSLDSRIQGILDGCSGHLVILPRRQGPVSGPEYRNLLAEIHLSSALRLPLILIAEDGVEVPSELGSFHRIDGEQLFSGRDDLTERIRGWAAEQYRQLSPPRKPHYVFLATDYDDTVVIENMMKHITQVAGVPCLKGRDFEGQIPGRKIEFAIKQSLMTISNLVSGTGADGKPVVNWNTCIEAGIAMGAGRTLHMIARRSPRDRWQIKEHLPFMVRDNTVQVYADDQDLMGLAHKFARTLRRRIIGTAI